MKMAVYNVSVLVRRKRSRMTPFVIGHREIHSPLIMSLNRAESDTLTCNWLLR